MTNDADFLDTNHWMRRVGEIQREQGVNYIQALVRACTERYNSLAAEERAAQAGTDDLPNFAPGDNLADALIEMRIEQLMHTHGVSRSTAWSIADGELNGSAVLDGGIDGPADQD